MKNSAETLLKKREKIARWKKIKSGSVPKTKMRICKDCGELKPCRWMSTFSQGSGTPLYRTRCNNCHNKYLQRIRKKPGYKIWRNKTRKANADKRKNMALEELGGKCSVCGYDKCVAALTFHHRDPKDKVCTIAQLYDSPIEKFMEEVKKCVVMCQNCHMEFHWNEGRGE